MATDGTSSAFISHLHSFPIVNDGVTYFKSHPIGQRSIQVSNSAYENIIKPFSPYIAKANDYASPYVSKVDNLADSGLGKVEDKFPIVKESTETIKGKVTETVGYPRKRASDAVAFGTNQAKESSDYVLHLYRDQLEKFGGSHPGLLSFAKASLVTSVIVSAQVVGWFASLLRTKKEETKEKAEEAKDAVEEKAEQN